MSQQALPVIVAFGGINGAGRSSAHRSYGRLVERCLPVLARREMLQALAAVMGRDRVPDDERELLDGTLIRAIDPRRFDTNSVPWNQRVQATAGGSGTLLELRRRQLPEPLPPGWTVVRDEGEVVEVRISGSFEFLVPARRELDVRVAGQLPTGFDPAALYPSRNHPRGLQLAIYAASDALGSLGIEWDSLFRHVAVDQVSVYAGSAMGQLDDAGTGGMLKARANGARVTSKQCPLGLAEMPSDFINAYVLGALGNTGASLGACASFLYNLRHAVHDIRSGRARVAVVGAAEAPILPEVLDGYDAMGALATVKGLRQLEGIGSDTMPDLRRACRPFADNCGFTLAESAQALILFDDALALELGACIHGAAVDVFVNADGYKKSISGPGVGNYLTMAKATATARAVVGDRALRRGGFVQAHGTGTPQNRTTESRILSQVAGAFGIGNWPVAAVKCFLGHSLGAASGDQLVATLGTWKFGWLPGIETVDGLADDVARGGLDFCLRHREVDLAEQAYAIINSKGFGGNNASGLVLSPQLTAQMLRQRHGERAWMNWQAANEAVVEHQQVYDDAACQGRVRPVYRFGEDVLDDADIKVGREALRVGSHEVSLALSTPFPDMHTTDD